MARKINQESLRLFVLLAGVDKLRPFADTAMRLGLRPARQAFRPLTKAESNQPDVSCNVRSLCEWLEDIHPDDQWIAGLALATIAARTPALVTTSPIDLHFPLTRQRSDLTGVQFASSSDPQYQAASLDIPADDDTPVLDTPVAPGEMAVPLDIPANDETQCDLVAADAAPLSVEEASAGLACDPNDDSQTCSAPSPDDAS